MKCIFRNRLLVLVVGVCGLALASFGAAGAQGPGFHPPPQAPPNHPPPAPPPSPPAHTPPVIVRPPMPTPVVPSIPVAPPPAVAKTGPTPAEKAEMLMLQKQIEDLDNLTKQRQADMALLEEEIADKEQTIETLDERIAIFSDEKKNILDERDEIRRSLESYRLELTDNEFFMKVGVNMNGAAAPGHPLTVGLMDYFCGQADGSIRFYQDSIDSSQAEIAKINAKIQDAEDAINQDVENMYAIAANPDARDREWYAKYAEGQAARAPGRIQEVKDHYAPVLEIFKQRIKEYHANLSDCMTARDRLLAMRPTVLGAEDRIQRIESRAVELDRLISVDVSDRDSVRGLDLAYYKKGNLERALAVETDKRNHLAAALNKLRSGGGSEPIAAIEPAPTAPAPEAPAVEAEPQKAEATPEAVKPEPSPVMVQQPADSAADIADQRAQFQQDIQYHLQNRDRAKAELRSIQQRSGTEAQQADLRARIAASEEFAMAAGRELTRLGGSPADYVRQDLSDYDPYKLTATDLKLMDMTARQRAEQAATDQIIKTRAFIRNATDQADAIGLIQNLERIAGFDNQGGLRDFERLDAVREFRRTVYETRTQADFSEQMLEATLAKIDNTAYEVGASRVKTGATLTLAVGTGALGMAAMAGELGLVGAGAAIGTQAAGAAKVLMVYNISTGTISGYSSNGVKGAIEGAGKETLPINTCIAIRDGKGAASIAVGLLQDAGNVLQIYSFAKTLKTAVQAKAAANVQSGLKGPEAAFEHAWKLDQAQADFLSTQMNAQATVANAVDSQASPGKSAPQNTPAKIGTAPAKAAGGVTKAAVPALSAVGTPMGKAWVVQTGGNAQFRAGEEITGLEKLGLSGAAVKATLPVGLTSGATMSEVKAAGDQLIKNFDTQVLPVISPNNAAGAAKGDAPALGLTPRLERQVDIVRGMSEGRYSAIVADKMLRQETGQGLAESMARLSGTIAFVNNL